MASRAGGRGGGFGVFIPDPLLRQQRGALAGCAGSTVTIQPRLCNEGACDKRFDWTFEQTGGSMVVTFATAVSGSILLPGNRCTCIGNQCGAGDLVVSVNVVIPSTATSKRFVKKPLPGQLMLTRGNEALIGE